MQRFKHILIAMSVTFFAFFATSCEFLDALGGDCNAFQAQLDQSKMREGMLHDRIPMQGAFAMALVLNQETVNKMFHAAADWSYEVDLFVVGFTVQAPLIQLGGYGSCLDCFVFDIPINLRIAGQSISARAAFQFPIESRTVGVEKTEIYANFLRADLLEISAMDYAIPTYILGPLQEGLKMYLQDTLRDVRLFDIAAWEIGDNDVKLLAGAPKINPIEHTLTFGMYSNLIMALETSVTWDEAFPKDAEMALHIHPELIRAIIGRMLHEGHIDRQVRLAESNETSGSMEGGFAVTLNELNSNIFPAREYFNMGFRLWKTDTGCGYIDIAAGIKLSISDEKFEFGIGDIKSVGAAGSGTLYALIINTLTSTPFFQQMLGFANITINFNEINLPIDSKGGMKKAEMGSQSFILALDGNGISLYLNFLDF